MESRLAGSDPRDPARENLWTIEFNSAGTRWAEDLIVHNHGTGSGSVRPLEGGYSGCESRGHMAWVHCPRLATKNG